MTDPNYDTLHELAMDLPAGAVRLPGQADMRDLPFRPPLDAPNDGRNVAARAYVAGILDGEGYIGACRRRPTKSNRMVSPRYSIRVSVLMVDEAPVRFVADVCGCPEKVYLRDRRRKAHHNATFIIDLEGRRAADLLTRVMPFMLGKRNQAELTLEFYALLQQARQYRTKLAQTLQFKRGRMKGSPYSVFALSDEYVRRCDEFYLRLRRRAISNSGVERCAF